MALTPTHAPALSSFASTSTSSSTSSTTTTSTHTDVNFHADEDVDAQLGRSWAAKEAKARWARDPDGNSGFGERIRGRDGNGNGYENEDENNDADADDGAFRLGDDGYRGRDRKIRIGIGGSDNEDEEGLIDGKQNGRRVLQTEEHDAYAPTAGTISKVGAVNAPALPGIRDMFPGECSRSMSLFLTPFFFSISFVFYYFLTFRATYFTHLFLFYSILFYSCSGVSLSLFLPTELFEVPASHGRDVVRPFLFLPTVGEQPTTKIRALSLRCCVALD